MRPKAKPADCDQKVAVMMEKGTRARAMQAHNEAVTGQLYVAIIMARLVSLMITGRRAT